MQALLLMFWAHNRRRILFVYSNSPNWKEYFEREILPQLPQTATILNWSDRKKWPRGALSTLLFRTYAGQEEFNPIGIMWQPFRRVRIFRFWKPLPDARHGKPRELARLTAEFIETARRQG